MFRAWFSLRRFNRLDRSQRTIVFYAESRADWAHLGPLVEELTERYGRSVCYVTSDATDPVLSTPNSRIQAFFVGSGAVRTTFFRLLDASVMVMTLPDLETYHLKRSVHPVHYVYVFHSMVSTHMIYRKGAFDAFDTILCVGPHHEAELRRTEEVYGLPRKSLVPHGYGRLDAILAAAGQERGGGADVERPRRILLAPSWGEGSFIEAPVGTELIRVLLDGGHDVVLRLHPMTVRRFPRLASEIEQRFVGGALRIETDMREQASLHESDLMIGDWSGAALEYAFGRERPVLFIDMPPKVNNPEHERLGIAPIEETIRTQIGAIVDPTDLGAALPAVEELTRNAGTFAERLREARDRAVYNVGRSASVGATEIIRLADDPQAAAGARNRT
jgi:hypothetical protein